MRIHAFACPHTRRCRAQLAEAVPVPGSGTSLPLDLHQIASRCSNAFYSPKRFAAVQLAFDVPRSRVLLFHTGRIVGTGCSGVMEARLSVARAVRQMTVQAGVHVYLRNFQIINQVRLLYLNTRMLPCGPRGLPPQVGAASLHARLDCERFATTHSSNAHFDIKSFIGLAWRPSGEACCCEIYGTGRMNLPGSTRERDLLRSFSRMYPQLIVHSDHPERLCQVPEHLRDAHKPGSAAHSAAPSAPAALSSLFDCDAGGDEGAGSLSGLGLPPLASHATDDAAGAYADDQDDEWLLGAGF
jgi:TATA-box binding protein (TBP) (component of TFIID and TFIIIB)